MTQEELRTLYISQRDKHLEQFMAINARSVFVVLALVVSILVGFDKIQALPMPSKTVGAVAAGFFCLGLLLLTLAAVFISLFHTAMIRALETKSWLVKELTKEDFRIIPPEGWKNPFRLSLMGVLCISVAILIPLKYRFLG